MSQSRHVIENTIKKITKLCEIIVRAKRSEVLITNKKNVQISILYAPTTNKLDKINISKLLLVIFYDKYNDI